MLLIPAIDLKGGQCVRLRQGDMDAVTVYSDDPVAMARQWVEAGARRLHIVDLDGAFDGKPAHARVIEAICREIGDDVSVQIGGGIRDEETVETYIEAGARYVIIGTKAVSEPLFVENLCAEFPSHVIVGLDVRDGRVAVDGWSKLAQSTPIELARHFEECGVEAIVHTDISRDGMLSGANFAGSAALAEAVGIPVIVSGGVASLDDVDKLIEYRDSGILGAITGRAIYEGTLDFAAGVERLKAHPSLHHEG